MSNDKFVKELKEDSHDYAMGYLNEVANLILKQQGEIQDLKELFGCDPSYYKKSEKTLTDDEIIEVHINTPFIDGYLNKNLIEFARAILRKAQEK